MEKLKIERLLLKKSSEIEHLKTSELKVEALLKFLEIEYEKNQDIDVCSSVRKELRETLNELNKIDILTELDYSIKILQRFQESKQFNLILIPNAHSKDLSEKFKILNSLLSEMVASTKK